MACCVVSPAFWLWTLPVSRSKCVRDVRVRVDPAGHHRQAAQVIGGFGGIRIDPDDLRAFDDERDIAEDAALSIEHGRRPNHDRARLALGSGSRR